MNKAIIIIIALNSKFETPIHSAIKGDVVVSLSKKLPFAFEIEASEIEAVFVRNNNID